MKRTLREQVLWTLRRGRLLQFYDRLNCNYAIWRSRRDNRDFVRRHPDFPVPPLDLMHDAYHHTQYRVYRDMGLWHAEYIARLIEIHLRGCVTEVLEWGCGPARVIRHLPARLPARVRLVGTDFNHRSIDWCKRNIPDVHFEVNGLAPPLPLAPGRFDAIFVMSVFTHLSEAMHEAWRDELARLLRKGSVLILTVHGDKFRDRHLNDQERRAYDAGQLVVRGGVAEGRKWFCTFHPPAYVRETLLRGFDVVAHEPEPRTRALEQDVWVARKR